MKRRWNYRPRILSTPRQRTLSGSGEPAGLLCDHLEGWDREGGRETQEGGDMGICVYV